MSQPSSKLASGLKVAVQRPKFSIYTVMLMLALGALLFGCLFLYLEIQAYGGFSAVSGGT